MRQVSEAMPAATPQRERRQYLKYSFFKVRPEWRRRSAEERASDKAAFVEALRAADDDLAVRTYSLSGLRADADFLIWTIGDSLDPIRASAARWLSTPMGAYLDATYSYLAMSKSSQYLGDHRHAGQEGTAREPVGRRFLFVYPFVKKRSWYSLPFEERQRIMGPHFRIGHKYPQIKIHTGYSFGLDDHEFVLAFEADEPGDFLDLVQELRTTEASQYTERETPIFTCAAATAERLVEEWGG